MICGIDPGIKGAIVIANREGVFDAYIMPNDVTEVQEILAEHEIKLIYIEKAQTMKGDGIKGNWTYATGYGQLLGLFKALRYPYIEIPPRTWQLPMHKGCNVSDGPKERSMQAAYKLFPHMEFRLPNEKTGKICKKPHDGIIDAALIAEYGRRDYYLWNKDIEKPPKAC